MLRSIEIGGLLLAIVLALRVLELPLPLPPLLAVIGLLALVNLFTWWRLRQAWPVADGEFFAQLLVDVVAITVLLYYAGGSTNPLVSFYLVPLVIAAITLPAAYTWAMALLTAGCYTLLMFNYYPLMPEKRRFQHGDLPAPHRHVADFRAFRLSHRFFRGAHGHCHQGARPAACRGARGNPAQRAHRGARHPGGGGGPRTGHAARHHGGGDAPNCSRNTLAKPALVDDLRLLRQQVDNCKQILSNMLAAAGQGRAEDAVAQPLDQYFAASARKVATDAGRAWR